MDCMLKANKFIVCEWCILSVEYIACNVIVHLKSLTLECPHLQLKINDLESEYRSKTLLAKSNYESQLIQSFSGSHNSKIYDYIRTLCKNSTIYPLLFLSIPPMRLLTLTRLSSLIPSFTQFSQVALFLYTGHEYSSHATFLLMHYILY